MHHLEDGLQPPEDPSKNEPHFDLPFRLAIAAFFEFAATVQQE
jgi:hypothetical protein